MWPEQSPILTGIPAGSIHDGGRIAFGPDGKLYVATGESGNPPLAQDRSSLGGKILRFNTDGSVPSDNPDPASPVWSFGRPNIHGLAWDSAGRLWATEYGANRLDELNLIQRYCDSNGGYVGDICAAGQPPAATCVSRQICVGIAHLVATNVCDHTPAVTATRSCR